MRDPSLHIKLSDFIKVLEAVGVGNSEKTAEAIFHRSQPYAIKDRYIIKGDAKTVAKAQRALASTTVGFTPEQLNAMVTSIRMERGDRRIRKILKGTPEWAMLKEINQLAVEFANLFTFGSISEGVKTFLTIGMELMGKKYALNKYKYWNNKISDFYEAKLVLNEDSDPEGSVEFWEAWKEVMQEWAGTEIDILVPDKFKHIIYARQEADDSEAEYIDWITAQFEELAYLEAIPDLVQLYGDNAKLRYDKYMLNKNKPGRKAKQVNGKQSEEVYNLPDSLSQEQADYFAALQARKKK